MSKITIAIIPVRGGSVGIPRKNARLMAGKPLLAYVVEAAVNTETLESVYVSTDDDELAEIALRYGAQVLPRPAELATGSITLDEVIAYCAAQLTNNGVSFDYVTTIQATSPLLLPETIDTVVKKCMAENLDTCLTVKNQSHLAWGVNKQGTLHPQYEKRLNRQELPPCFVETGGVVVCRKNILESGSRFGVRVGAVEVSEKESIDIDNYFDWWLAEKCLQRKSVCFHVIGNRDNGMGHIYRALTLADRMIDHELCFLVNSDNALAAELIRKRNYRVTIVEPEKELDWLLRQQPDIVINDILDTNSDYMRPLKENGIKTVNFEDLGEGSTLADVVINAMFDESPYVSSGQIYHGVQYCVLRDEFFSIPPIELKPTVKNILLMFGGTDPSDLTSVSLDWMDGIDGDWKLTVILGLGYPDPGRVQEKCEKMGIEYELIRTTPIVSRYMAQADIAITSAGRTVFELASLGVPMIVIPQNDREETHEFAMNSPGVISLPRLKNLSREKFRSAFSELLQSQYLRRSLNRCLIDTEIQKGTDRVLSIIDQCLTSKGRIN